MSDTYANVIDLASLERNWADGHVVPQVILELADLIKPWSQGSVGYLSIRGNRLDDYFIELGSDLNAQFGRFLHFSDGTVIALWFHDGAVKNAEPVVELGSEGDLNVLAPNLKSFLTNWAQGTGHRELEIEEEERTPERIAQRKMYGDQMLAVIQNAPDHPTGASVANLEHFMDQHSLKALAKFAADPTMQAISSLLDRFIPKGPEFQTVQFRIDVAGDRIEIFPPGTPESGYKIRVLLPEREALIPLILKTREKRAVPPFTARGLWHVATLELHNLPEEFAQGGHAYIKAAWDEEPQFKQGGRVTKAELNADLKRFPRSSRWIESWMSELA
jgi:hypothetical protein